MVTKIQAIELGLTGGEVHFGDCTTKPERWQVTGLCRTWGKAPRFRLPITNGLRQWAITESNNDMFHRAQDCHMINE
mgnify:CR=1 FL=1